jgi:glycosyltransferase involved in cell wall biosynthesis
MDLSVIIPSHNPDTPRLRRVLFALQAQTLPVRQWEIIIVNNASDHFPNINVIHGCTPDNVTYVEERELGLTAARRCGFKNAQGKVAVLVDDDNVLARDYLAEVLAIFERQPRVGIAGGKSLPEFERPPVGWENEFLPLLALRDLGPHEIISRGLRPPGGTRDQYPEFAPIGAGMAIRREAWTPWLATLERDDNTFTDRHGDELTSSGDNDMVLCAMRAGWEAGYFPSLSLKHLIPASRLEAAYLARLNRGIQQSWQQVLAHHEASPWPPLSPFGAELRKAKAWLTHRAWSSPAARIRWQGACGHFDGRVVSV